MLTLFAALIGPYFIDWSSYRTDFEREASKILGRQVKVEGTATARLLPFPSVTFSDVRVAGADPAAPAMTVDKFSMDAELAPFLRGEILIFDMRLVHPHLTVSIGKDGTVDLASRAKTLFDPHQVTLEKVAVSNGEITINHGAGDRTYLLSNIDADLSAKSLAGPWRFDGTLDADGEPVTVALSTGPVDEKGHIHLRIRAKPRDYPVTIETDGDAGIDKGVARYAGGFHLDARNTQDDKQAADGNSAGKATEETGKADRPAPYRVTGDFSFDDKQFSIDKFRFETGPQDNPYTANGSAFIDIGPKPSFGITAKGAQVRFDDALGGSDKPGSALTLDDRIAAFKRVVEALPKPAIPGKLDIDLPAVLTGDTTIRNVKVTAQPALGGWKVETLDATLPGRTALEAKGFLRTGDNFGFAGSLVLAVKQPSGFAAWISHDVDEAIRRLPAAGFQANVDISQHKQVFHDLELILGDARFHGSIENTEPDDANPSMVLKLDGGKLDVEGLTAFASLFVSDQGKTRLADHDIDLEVKAGPVTATGITAKTIDAGLRLSGGQLEIDRLSVDGLAGATISATGSMKDLATTPTGNIDASIVSVDLAPLVSLLAERYPGNALVAGLNQRARGYGGLLTDARIDLVASAAANKDGSTGVALSTHGKAGGSAFTFSASGNGRRQAIGQAHLSLTGSLSNDEAAPVYALFGLPTLPIDAAGHTEASLAAKGSLGGGLATSLSISGKGLAASFDGKLKSDGQSYSAVGQAKLHSENLQPWLMTAGVGLPGTGLGLPVALAAKVAMAQGSLSVDELKGSIAGSALSGKLNAELKDGLPRLSGSVSADTVDLGLAADMLLGEQSLQSNNGKWPTAPFNAEAEPALLADLQISAKTLEGGPLFVAHDAKLTARLDRDGLQVSDLVAKADGGALSGLFELRNNGGTGLLSGQMKLKGAHLGELLKGSGLSGDSDLSAAVTASGKSVDGMVAALAGSGTLAFRDLVAPGINTGGFAAILAGADRIGRDIDAGKTAAFAPAIIGDGKFAVAQGELAFTIAEGILRAPPLRLEDKNATVTVNPSIDFNSATAAVDGDIAYKAGEEALVGSEPDVNFSGSGPLGGMKFKLDTAPLAQFLTQRALEREEARVEALQSALLEKQRLRREVLYYEDRDKTRLRLEEEAREKAAAEAAAKAAAEAQAAEEAEKAKEKAAEEARQKALEDAQQAEAAKKAEAVRLKAAAEAAAKAEQEAQQEAARKAAEEARQKSEDEARQKALEAARQAAAEKARKEAEDARALEDKIQKLLQDDNAAEEGSAVKQKSDGPEKIRSVIPAIMRPRKHPKNLRPRPVPASRTLLGTSKTFPG